MSLYQGQLLAQIQLEGNATSTSMRFYKDLPQIEIETFVDSIDVSDFQGKEVVMQIVSDLNNN